MQDSIRGWNDVLGLWRLCRNAKCMRACACRGEAAICLRAHFRLLPESMQVWFLELGTAQQEGASFDEAIEGMEGTIAESALERWHQAIAESRAVTEAPSVEARRFTPRASR